MKIYIKLLDEDIEVYRPIDAILIDKKTNLFKIPEEAAVPELEVWEFKPGDVVKCKLKDGNYIAISRIDEL